VRKLLVAALVLAAALGVGSSAQGALPRGNLVANGGAENGTAGWTTSGSFTTEPYGAATPGRGANFFSGGAQPPSSAAQTVDLTRVAKPVDATRVDARVSAATAGPATLTVRLDDARGRSLSSRNILGADTIPIPPHARSATLTMKARGPDALFDNVSFTLIRRDLPRPQRGKTVLVEPAKGVTVLLRRGNRKVITRPALVPVGSTLDTSRGTATIVSANDRYGLHTGRGSFSEGTFRLAQAGGITSISLGGRNRSCKRPRRLVSRATDSFTVLAGASASRPSGSRAVWVADDRCTKTTIKTHQGRVDVMPLGSRTASGGTVRRLWGHARGGFRTRGRNSSATVRGRVMAG
jgi:hypothetical protein